MSRCSRVCGIDALVGGDDQQHDVDAARARDHGADEALVAGHVDHRQRLPPAAVMRCAKPSSMVMPRAFSSGSRSVSMPVSARTSAVLP